MSDIDIMVGDLIGVVSPYRTCVKFFQVTHISTGKNNKKQYYSDSFRFSRHDIVSAWRFCQGSFDRIF